MESTRPIRALMRGLDALTVLNAHDGATVSEVAHEIRLPRTTVYRILETLSTSGYIYRDPTDDRYRLNVKVRALSGGFEDEPWVAAVAPLLGDLSREITAPVNIATLSGGALIVREAAADSSAAGLERVPVGTRLPLLTSAAGRVYLAFSPADERDRLTGPAPAEELLAGLNAVKSDGYAVVSHTHRRVEEISVSVPVPATLGTSGLACLTVRFNAATTSEPLGVERFVPALRQCAAKIITLV
jgi:IclR family transcriptional regulator, mhp operon transcriptional activator